MDTEFTIFWRSLLIYVDCYDTIGDITPLESDEPPREMTPFSSLNAPRHSLTFFSARLADQLHYNVTHVLVDPTHTERFQQVSRNYPLLYFDIVVG